MSTYNARQWARDLEAAIEAAGLNDGAPHGRATDRAVAAVVGKESRTVGRWRAGENMPAQPDRAVYLDRLRARRPVRLERTGVTVSSISFSTEAERVAHAVGVLTMADMNNDQVKRCISEAIAALLSPVPGGRGPAEPASAPPDPQVTRLLRAKVDARGTDPRPAGKRGR